MIVPLSRTECIFLKEHYDKCSICGTSIKGSKLRSKKVVNCVVFRSKFRSNFLAL